jgi:hypothetical protein
LTAGEGYCRINLEREKPMKKYKVIITRETIVEAKDEEEAKDMAFDSMIHGDVDFKVEEEDE